MKNEVDNPKQKQYPGIRGNERKKMDFAFKMIPITLYVLVGSIIAIILIGAIFKIDINSYISVIVPALSAPLMFMLGSIYGKQPD